MIQQKNLLLLKYEQIFNQFYVPFIHFCNTKVIMDHKKKRVMQIVAKICNYL